MADLLENFDPNGIGLSNGNLFGLPFHETQANVVLIPVPWEVTVSSAAGTGHGPQSILEASLQVDLHDPFVPNAWRMGLHMLPISKRIAKLSRETRPEAEEYIHWLAEGSPEKGEKKMAARRDLVNEACMEMNGWVLHQTRKLLEDGKFVGLVGGDHSTPMGLLQALGEVHPRFGILQIDAHCDLRQAYEGFDFSHASIMYNACKLPATERLVQVGIRDYSEGELNLINANPGMIRTFFDRDLKQALFEGRSWRSQVNEIIRALPEKVYISFDIDGLSPDHCPNTGTPVPGGLAYEQALYLLERVSEERQIIGFDLVEVAGNENNSATWDANVGSRLLYRLANLSWQSHQQHVLGQAEQTSALDKKQTTL